MKPNGAQIERPRPRNKQVHPKATPKSHQGTEMCLLCVVCFPLQCKPGLQATASAADLKDSSDRGLDPWRTMLLSMDTFGVDVDCRGVHFGGLGLTWVTSWKAFVPFGIHWARQGTQINYLTFLCRRGHQFKDRGGGGELELGRPVAAYLDTAVAPIENS